MVQKYDWKNDAVLKGAGFDRYRADPRSEALRLQVLREQRAALDKVAAERPQHPRPREPGVPDTDYPTAAPRVGPQHRRK